MRKTNNQIDSVLFTPYVQFPRPSILKLGGNFIQETYALTKRLVLQAHRRPATLLAGLFQPLLWLVLFGALFQNAPIEVFSTSNSYRHFLTPGILVFTAFTGALNAGLPLMFDREFGFFNRLIVAPLISQLSIVMASALFISSIALLQTFIILLLATFLEKTIYWQSFLLITIVLGLLTTALTMFSISLSLILPGHIELLALIFIINLPLLFSSTALVPFSFMPTWLQIMASINPLSYTIETIRSLYVTTDLNWTSCVVKTIWGEFSLTSLIILMILFNLILGFFVTYSVNKKIK
uniref:ABC-2 type transporter n=1 Tax=Goniotrichopsis reniformis TaxID=468933 RepID=UPI001FCD8A6A|nr:ABC-2 type transporter [Goniotrichopsis reniformis]UNJ14807.1 ABC-2 type transporter [Goniotrichopsis reniformis]